MPRKFNIEIQLKPGTVLPTSETENASQQQSHPPWDLSDLLADPSEEGLGREIETLDTTLREFERHASGLSPTMDPQDFLRILRLFEGLMARVSRLRGYGELLLTADTSSARAASFHAHMAQVLTEVHHQVLPLGLWWQNLEEDQALRLLPEPNDDPRNHDLRFYLLKLRSRKPYHLDERSEKILSTKNTHGIEAILNLYSMLVARLEFHSPKAGEDRTLAESELRSFFASPDPQLRRAASTEFLRVYERECPILAQIYANRVRDWRSEYVDLRGFGSPIAMRHLSNDLDEETVTGLLAAVERNTPLFQTYFRLKGKALGLESLHRADLFAPLSGAEKHIPYDEAVALVLSTFHDFDPLFGELASRVIERNHVDAGIRRGKRSEALCASPVPDLTPWISMHYAGRPKDVAILAHEMGHAVHGMLASHHSPLTHHPSILLGETASIFAEMLVTERLLSLESDPVVRRDLLAAGLDEIYTTTLRHCGFVRFELAAHEAIHHNGSAEDLCDLYLEGLRRQLGAQVQVPDEFRFEWVSIPHIYQMPFYGYAYAFGQLLALTLYRRYRMKGSQFAASYLRLLGHGGSSSLSQILAEVGLDPRKPDLWQEGFDVVRRFIGELDQLS